MKSWIKKAPFKVRDGPTDFNLLEFRGISKTRSLL